MTALPNPLDRAAAEKFVAETYDSDPAVSRQWLADHRRDLVRQASVAAMQKREHRLFKASRLVGWPADARRFDDVECGR